MSLDAIHADGIEEGLQRWAANPGPAPELSVVAFSHRDGDAPGERLLAHLQAEGRILLSGTRVDGRFLLRAAILCFRTHREHVDIAVDAIRAGVEAIRG